MIRVFARKTKWCPTDELAFFDEPPLYDLPDMPVYVSVTFTWDRERSEQLFRDWSIRCREVRIGGPAYDDPGGDFEPGRFIKKGVVITSRGCPKKCPWCMASQREGSIRELKVREGFIVNDNNLLACSRAHIESVFGMLKKQKEAADFRGGLDIDYLESWHVDCFKQMRISNLWVACDTNKAIAKIDKAADLLGDFPQNKKRCYVMIGFDNETLEQAENRLKYVYNKGFLPFAQIYRSNNDKLKHFLPEWRALQRLWCRPAGYRTMMKTPRPRSGVSNEKN